MMTKGGAVLSAIGSFLVVLALLANFWAPGQLMKTPLDVNQTTDLSGTATLSGETGPVLAWSITHTNSEKSDDDVAVWENSSCLVKDEGGITECVSADDPQKRLIAAGVDTFATDRVTGIAVNDPKYLPAEAEEKQGLVNKWPFESEKKTYPYWDDLTQQAEDADYARSETVQGLEIYVYTVNISDAPIEIIDGVRGTYDDQKEIWVEPLTGAIVNQIDHQVRSDRKGKTVLDLTLQFTDAEIKSSIDDAQANKDKLNLVRQTVPLVGLLVGIPLLLIGLVLSFLGRRKEESRKDGEATSQAEPETTRA